MTDNDRLRRADRLIWALNGITAVLVVAACVGGSFHLAWASFGVVAIASALLYAAGSFYSAPKGTAPRVGAALYGTICAISGASRAAFLCRGERSTSALGPDLCLLGPGPWAGLDGLAQHHEQPSGASRDFCRRLFQLPAASRSRHPRIGTCGTSAPFAAVYLELYFCGPHHHCDLRPYAGPGCLGLLPPDAEQLSEHHPGNPATASEDLRRIARRHVPRTGCARCGRHHYLSKPAYGRRLALYLCDMARQIFALDFPAVESPR